LIAWRNQRFHSWMKVAESNFSLQMKRWIAYVWHCVHLRDTVVKLRLLSQVGLCLVKTQVITKEIVSSWGKKILNAQRNKFLPQLCSLQPWMMVNSCFPRLNIEIWLAVYHHLFIIVPDDLSFWRGFSLYYFNSLFCGDYIVKTWCLKERPWELSILKLFCAKRGLKFAVNDLIMFIDIKMLLATYFLQQGLVSY